MLRVRTHLAKSHGLGLFATDPIPRGTLVWVLDPLYDRIMVTITSELELVTGFLDKYTYRDKHTLDYVLPADDARFMNHSDTPNVGPVAANGFAYGADVALRDIKSGEEIVIDYRAIHAGPWHWEPTV